MMDNWTAGFLFAYYLERGCGAQEAADLVASDGVPDHLRSDVEDWRALSFVALDSAAFRKVSA